MKLLPIKIFFGCLLFFNPASASQALPDDLITYMDSLDISYTPIDDKDLSPSTRIYGEPYVRITDDFDGDDRVDYALLVNSRKSYISVVIFLRRGVGFTHEVIYDANFYHFFDNSNIDVTMSPVKKGNVNGAEGTLNLKHTGIYIAEEGMPTSSVYYWDGDRFARFWISD